MRGETVVKTAQVDENQLIGEYRKGDQGSLDLLFNQNKDLIWFIYQKFFKDSGCPKEDMFQEGCIGLFEAIKRFSPEKAHMFNGYKCIWIKKKMYDFRRKFFKLKFVELPKSYEAVAWEPSKADKLRKEIFEIDFLNLGGKIPRRKKNKKNKLNDKK